MLYNLVDKYELSKLYIYIFGQIANISGSEIELIYNNLAGYDNCQILTILVIIYMEAVLSKYFGVYILLSYSVTTANLTLVMRL